MKSPKTIVFLSLITSLFGFLGCSNNTESKSKVVEVANEDSTVLIDKTKRDALVEKYDLLNFVNNELPIIMSLDEFFDGNNDDGSIAPNLDTKPPMSEYYNILKQISINPKITTAFIELKDVNIYNNNQLDDNEWFYTDIVYFVGDITLEDVKSQTKKLKPDEVEYLEETDAVKLNPEFKGQKVVYLWWD